MDSDLLHRLLALMDEGNLLEIEHEQDGTRVRLSRRAPAGEITSLLAPSPVALPADPVAPTLSPAEPVGEIFQSPMVGTFYAATTPEADPFVQVGDSVSPDSVLCILEAMKVMNEIKAEQSGQILAILVENGDPVEFGQALFRIGPS